MKGARADRHRRAVHSRLGWFNPATKEFRQNEIDEQTEVLSITGNIAENVDEGGRAGTEVKLHLHVVLGCGDATRQRRAPGRRLGRPDAWSS